MSKQRLLILFIACLVVGATFASPCMASINRDYTAEELKQLIDSGQPVFLLNPLSEIEFNEGHIPGSVNIPAEEILRSKRLPKDKKTLIVTYCKGPK